MSEKADLFKIYGTNEPVAEPRRVTAGDMSVEVDGGKLRNICWKGEELVRGIDYPIRDESWGTVSVIAEEDAFTQDSESWTYNRRFRSVDEALEGALITHGNADGTLTIEVVFTAKHDYQTTRTGFTVLHPIDGLAGGAVVVTHSDGNEEALVFPKEISPSQPVYDIAGLSYKINGVRADIAFEGDVFEMEDQRNWTDASFKTYCRPLGLPAPFTIARGETLRQKITVSFAGDGPEIKDQSATRKIVATPSVKDDRVPEVLLALQADMCPAADQWDLLKNTGVPRLSVRVSDADEVGQWAEQVKEMARPIDLEVILNNDLDEATQQLDAIRLALTSSHLSPDHILAVPEDYLKSHQPDGQWPTGLTPQEAVGLARKVFPKSKIGGGVLTNFTEYNRCRPDAGSCDFVSHSSTAIVHAADDRSVFQTLEAQPEVYASTRKLSPETEYRLGLVSIAMRSNPYGQAPIENPSQVRLEMVQADPRQRGLLAAAWMVGAVAATSDFGISGIALAAAGGPLGLLHQIRDWPQPLYDEDEDRYLYPAYHVFKRIAELTGEQRCQVQVPPGVHAVLCENGEGLVSNGTAQSTEVELPGPVNVRMLDTASFEQATKDPYWLATASTHKTQILELGPYAVASVSGLHMG